MSVEVKSEFISFERLSLVKLSRHHNNLRDTCQGQNREDRFGDRQRIRDVIRTVKGKRKR
jgi:hypothetical protein